MANDSKVINDQKKWECSACKFHRAGNVTVSDEMCYIEPKPIHRKSNWPACAKLTLRARVPK